MTTAFKFAFNFNLRRYSQESEERHEELARRLPESTRPLLRQIEAMRTQQAEHGEAWSGAERALHARAADAEEAAAAAGAREAAAQEEASEAKAAARAAQSLAARVQAEQAAAVRALAAERAAATEERSRIDQQQESWATNEGRMHAMEDEARDKETRLRRQLAEERGHHEAAAAAWERERREVLEREGELLAQHRDMAAKLADKDASANALAGGVLRPSTLPTLCSDEPASAGLYEHSP